MWLGNLVEDSTLDFKFTTWDADGDPVTLGGSPAVSVYKGNGTTESTAGVTLTVDFDGRTGSHHIRIDTNADAFYAVANDYQVILTAGTVDGKSVNGVALAAFSIENRFKEADLVAIGGDAQSATDLKDFADAGYDPATNKVEGVKLADTLTTYTGNTPQTGDAFARLGAPAGASVSADIAAIEAQTDDIGANGAGLTAVPWNAAWDAEVQSEVTDALNAYDPPTKAELDSGLAALNDLSATEVEDAVWDATMADHLDAGSTGASLNGAGSAGDPWTTALPGAYGAGTAGKIVGDSLNATVGSRATQASVDTIDGIVDDILADTAVIGTPAGASIAADLAAIEAQTDDIGAAGAGLTAVPWNPAWDAEVQSEATDALNAYDPPTKAELDAAQAAIEALVNALNDVTAADVVTALKATTFAENAQGAPPTNPTLEQVLMLPYMRLINQYTADSDSEEIRNAAGTVIARAVLSDDGTTFTKAKMVSGP